MKSLFLGMTLANLLLLSIVFGVGLVAVEDAEATRYYAFHIALGIVAGMMALMCHVGTYMYFMATARWLEAASHKVGLPVARFATPALKRKTCAFAVSMAAILLVMLTMFAGAGADSTVKPWWPSEVHLAMGVICIAGNLGLAFKQFQMIGQQQILMDDALALVNGEASSAAPA